MSPKLYKNFEIISFDSFKQNQLLFVIFVFFCIASFPNSKKRIIDIKQLKYIKGKKVNSTAGSS